LMMKFLDKWHTGFAHSWVRISVYQRLASLVRDLLMGIPLERSMWVVRGKVARGYSDLI